jgi:hypothetical protein
MAERAGHEPRPSTDEEEREIASLLAADKATNGARSAHEARRL